MKLKMTDVTFTCPHCGQSLEAPADLTGQVVDCPGCGNAIEVGSGIARPPSPRRFVPPVEEPDAVPPPQGHAGYRRYEEVPWSRRHSTMHWWGGFGFVLWLYFGPLVPFLFLVYPSFVILSGPIYNKEPENSGYLKTWNWNWKLGIPIICVLSFVKLVAILMGYP